MNNNRYIGRMRIVFLSLGLIFFAQVNAQQIFNNMRASQLGDSIYVQWTLLANYSCNDMILERATGNGAFKPIFSVAGFCGATIDLNYQYLDGTNLQTSEIYTYRVSASNGIYTSNIASVAYNNSGSEDILIIPNPATDYFSISVNNTITIPFYAEVYTIDGKLVWASLLYDHLAQINSELGNGNYFLRLIADDGFPRSSFFIIQR